MADGLGVIIVGGIAALALPVANALSPVHANEDPGQAGATAAFDAVSETATLSEIHVFPVKGLSPVSPSTHPIDEYGMQYDRNWVVVGDNDKFLTPRTIPHMVLLRAEPDASAGVLRLTRPDTGATADASLDGRSVDGAPARALVWGQELAAVEDPNAATHALLSDYLGQSARLLAMGSDFVRLNDERGSRHADDRTDHESAFDDQYPFLLISQASLDDLNSRIADPADRVPMLRFRPNLVIAGCQPYEEDYWRRIRIGNHIFRVMRQCTRCKFTTVDHEKGEFTSQPLATLRDYRRAKGAGKGLPYFGVKLVCESVDGTLSVGDDVEVLEWADTPLLDG